MPLCRRAHNTHTYMKATQSNKLRRYQTLEGVLEQHSAVWSPLPAFARAVTELSGIIPQVTDALQTQSRAYGSTQEKEAALAALGDAAHEVAGAVFSCAAENADYKLMCRVKFSRTDITKGRESVVVARCRDIHAAASEDVAALADYGVNAAKLTAFKKKIDGFEALQTQPRQDISNRSAATQQLRQLLRQADEILRKRIDPLVVQFKASAPEFYNAYQAARSIVDAPGARETDETEAPKPSPAPAVS